MSLFRSALPLLLAALLAGCKDEQRNAYVAPPPPPVTVAAPEVRTVTDFIELTGTTQAIATVRPGGPGAGLPRPGPFPGRPAGQEGRPAVHDPAEHLSGAAASRRSRSSQSVQAQLLHAQTEFDRYSGLFKQKAASAVDVDTWRANRDQAQAGVLGAQAQLELAQINLGYTTVERAFRRAHGPASDRRRQSRRHRRPDQARRDQSDRPDLRLLHDQRARSVAHPRRARQGRQDRRAVGPGARARCCQRGRLPAPGQARLRRHHADRGDGYARAARDLPKCGLHAAARPVRPDPGSIDRAGRRPARSPNRDRTRPGRRLRSDGRCGGRRPADRHRARTDGRHAAGGGQRPEARTTG